MDPSPRKLATIMCVCDVFRFLDGWPGCCMSCHEDADEYGFDLIEHRVHGRRVEVCCGISNEFFEDGKHDDRDSQCACRGCMAVVKPVIREARVWWEAA